jgi:hypothetical protein
MNLHNQINKDKGFMSVAVILVFMGVLLVFGLFVYFLTSRSMLDFDLKDDKGYDGMYRVEDMTPEEREAFENELPFEELEDTEETPEELSKETIEELDALVDEVDQDDSLDIDTEDLGL